MLEAVGYIVLGAFLLMVPGFLFSAILYPRPEGIDAWTRAGMSFGLGIMLLLYVGYFLARPDLRLLQAVPFVGSVIGLCAVLAIIAYFRGGLGLIPLYARRFASAVGIGRRAGRKEAERKEAKPSSEAPQAGG